MWYYLIREETDYENWKAECVKMFQRSIYNDATEISQGLEKMSKNFSSLVWTKIFKIEVENFQLRVDMASD